MIKGKGKLIENKVLCKIYVFCLTNKKDKIKTKTNMEVTKFYYCMVFIHEHMLRAVSKKYFP